jgi:hypothetical protein
MAQEIVCPTCRRVLRASDETAGQEFQCPLCRTVFPASSSSDVQAETPAPRGRISPEAPWDRDEEIDVSRPGPALHHPGHATLATFLGSPLAGSIILALNYHRLGRAGAAWLSLLFGLLSTVGLMTLGFLLPEGVTLLPALVFLVAMHVLARALQQKPYEEHVDRGGPTAGAGSAVGVGLLCMVLVLGGAFGVGYAYDTWTAPPKLVYAPGKEIYYKEGATEADARRVGDLLQAEGYFQGSPEAAVVVSRRGPVVVSFCMVRGAWNEPQTLEFFRGLIPLLSQNVFGGQEVVIELCDESLTVRRTLR